jgi:hypothetical protein
MTTGSIGHGHTLNPWMEIPHDPMDTWTLGFLNLVWNLYFSLSKQYILVIQPTKPSKPGVKIFIKKIQVAVTTWTSDFIVKSLLLQPVVHLVTSHNVKTTIYTIFH